MKKILIFAVLLLLITPVAFADPFTDWFRGLFGITGKVTASDSHVWQRSDGKFLVCNYPDFDNGNNACTTKYGTGYILGECNNDFISANLGCGYANAKLCKCVSSGAQTTPTVTPPVASSTVSGIIVNGRPLDVCAHYTTGSYQCNQFTADLYCERQNKGNASSFTTSCNAPDRKTYKYYIDTNSGFNCDSCDCYFTSITCSGVTQPAPIAQPTCTPNCVGKQCGDNGCGGSCGTCTSGTCQSNSCIQTTQQASTAQQSIQIVPVVIPEQIKTCGNFKLDAGEICDPSLNKKKCDLINPNYYSTNYAQCENNCSGWDTSDCRVRQTTQATCIDSDGLNSNVKGTTTGIFLDDRSNIVRNYVDSCVWNRNIVNETYCVDNYVNTTEIYCEISYECKDGACILQTSLPVNGVCGGSLNNCTSGTLLDIPDNNTDYLWNCTGQNGGITSRCNLQIYQTASQASTSPTVVLAQTPTLTESSTGKAKSTTETELAGTPPGNAGKDKLTERSSSIRDVNFKDFEITTYYFIPWEKQYSNQGDLSRDVGIKERPIIRKWRGFTDTYLDPKAEDFITENYWGTRFGRNIYWNNALSNGVIPDSNIMDMYESDMKYLKSVSGEYNVNLYKDISEDFSKDITTKEGELKRKQMNLEGCDDKACYYKCVGDSGMGILCTIEECKKTVESGCIKNGLSMIENCINNCK